MAVSEAAVSLASFANLFSAANASFLSLLARVASYLLLFIDVRPRFVGREGLP
jgi:hypothetical protein